MKQLKVEIGSGSNPWQHADVLVDRFFTDPSFQRGGGELFIDARPLFIARGEALPFTDKAFEYSYTRHVIEHAVNLEEMLSEIGRISKAGYIECPNPLLEVILDQAEHNWVITVRDGVLIYIEKEKMRHLINTLGKAYFHLLSDHYLVRRAWPLFTVQHHWKDNLKFRKAVSVEEVLPTSDEVEALGEYLQGRKFRTMVSCVKEIVIEKTKNFTRNNLSPISRVVKSLARRGKMQNGAQGMTISEMCDLLRCPISGQTLAVSGVSLVTNDGKHSYKVEKNVAFFEVE